MTTEHFTKKEIEVLQLLGEGFTAIEIAKKLGKSKRTVDCQIYSARKRHNAKNAIHLYQIFINKTAKQN